MTAWSLAMDHWMAWLVWGLVASAAMATLLEGSQLLGYSRMSLPLLFGTFLTGSRRRAVIAGYFAYLVGGWLFALLYALLLGSFAGLAPWSLAVLGALIGLAHGAFLVAVFLPLLPYVHPRLATGYDGPGALGKIEPPGPMGLNYGRATPATTIAGQTLYGLILGIGYGIALGGVAT